MLTNREKEIVNFVMRGFSNKEIASNLNLNIKTVKFHMTNIMKKYNVKSRLQLALKYGGTNAQTLS